MSTLGIARKTKAVSEETAYLSLGQQLRRIRFKHNVTQEFVAKAISINKNTLGRMECDRTIMVNFEILTKLCHYYQVYPQLIPRVGMEPLDLRLTRRSKKPIPRERLQRTKKDKSDTVA